MLGIPCHEPFLFYRLAKLKSLTRSKTKNAPLSGSIISLQRERDSNPRYVAIYTLSKRAPSATRPPLYFVTAAKNIKKNELEKLKSNYYIISPRNEVSKIVLKSFEAIFWLNKYINFVIAASVVMSLPEMTPIFFMPVLVSY